MKTEITLREANLIYRKSPKALMSRIIWDEAFGYFRTLTGKSSFFADRSAPGNPETIYDCWDSWLSDNATIEWSV